MREKRLLPWTRHERCLRPAAVTSSSCSNDLHCSGLYRSTESVIGSRLYIPHVACVLAPHDKTDAVKLIDVLPFRAGQLSAAIHTFQQAASIEEEEDRKQDDCNSAASVAEASLKLAFLCNDMLQVGTLPVVYLPTTQFLPRLKS